MPSEAWDTLLARWPKKLPKQGLLVTTFDEQIPFVNFRTNAQFVSIERRAPDAMGARRVVIPFENIVALKFLDVIEEKSLAEFGFGEPAAESHRADTADRVAKREAPPAKAAGI